MNYRGFFWLLVTIGIIAFVMFVMSWKASHTQPVYEKYLGRLETPHVCQLTFS